jgi:hypothetical protein
VEFSTPSGGNFLRQNSRSFSSAEQRIRPDKRRNGELECDTPLNPRQGFSSGHGDGSGFHSCLPWRASLPAPCSRFYRRVAVPRTVGIPDATKLAPPLGGAFFPSVGSVFRHRNQRLGSTLSGGVATSSANSMMHRPNFAPLRRGFFWGGALVQPKAPAPSLSGGLAGRSVPGAWPFGALGEPTGKPASSKPTARRPVDAAGLSANLFGVARYVQ